MTTHLLLIGNFCPPTKAHIKLLKYFLTMNLNSIYLFCDNEDKHFSSQIKKDWRSLLLEHKDVYLKLKQGSSKIYAISDKIENINNVLSGIKGNDNIICLITNLKVSNKNLYKLISKNHPKLQIINSYDTYNQL